VLVIVGIHGAGDLAVAQDLGIEIAALLHEGQHLLRRPTLCGQPIDRLRGIDILEQHLCKVDLDLGPLLGHLLLDLGDHLEVWDNHVHNPRHHLLA
jgi:hypothetical protein